MTAVEREGAPDGPATHASRTPTILYAASFVLLVAALGFLLVAVRGFLSELWPLWLSAALSVVAILAAVAAFIVDRRR